MHYDTPDSLKKIQESSLAWAKIIEKIEHICVNKLAVLRSNNKNLEEIFPVLFKAYQIAFEHKLIDDKIEQGDIDYFYKQQHTDSSPLIEPMFDLFDTVYSFIKELIASADNNKSFSAKNSVENILTSYEFKSGERDIVFFKSEKDFHCPSSELFIKAALVEFFRFAFNHPDESNQKKIEIYFVKTDYANAIHFKLICSGIKENYEWFFDNSLVINANNISMGINFCRLALLNIGGNISYQSTKDKELEFIISIPQM